MEEQNKQAVVEETETVAPPTVEGADAQDEGDDLDKFLSEYVEGTKEKDAAEFTPEPGDDNRVLLQRVETLEQAIAARDAKGDLARMIEEIKGDYASPDWEVRGFIEHMAEQDQTLTRIFEGRGNDQRAYQRMVKGLAKKYAKEKAATQVDPNATEDKEAITQAVRGQSGKAPDPAPPDMSGMADGEAREAIKKMGISDPGF